MPRLSVSCHTITLLATPLLPLLHPPGFVVAVSVNRTIDDENGDSVTGVKPVYGPDVNHTGNWFQGLDCVHCTMLPGKVVDISQTFDGTWHDSTYHPGDPDHTIDAVFTGTAIYVYFIVPNFVQYTTTLVNLSFYIDNTYFNQYEHAPDSTTTILYQTLVFHTTNLVNTDHDISIRASGSAASLMLFDNMIYTFEEADSSPPPPPTVVSSPMVSSNAPASQAPQRTSTPADSDSVHSHLSLGFSSTSMVPSAASSSIVSPSNLSDTTLISELSLGIPSSPSSLPGQQITQAAPGIYSTVNTSPTGTSTPSGASPRVSAIAGGVAGGAAALALLIVLMCCLRRRARHRVSVTPPRSKKTDKTLDSDKRRSPAYEFVAGAVGDSPFTAAESPRVATQPSFRESHLTPLPRALRYTSPSTSVPIADSEVEEGNTIERIRTPNAAPSACTSSTSRTGVSTLRAEVANLRGELARLRHVEQEMHQLFLEPPPRYEES